MAEHDPTDPDERPDRFARLNARGVRLLGALVVVVLAALVAPILTTGPNRDDTAVETASGDGSTDDAVGLGDGSVDASVEAPIDEPVGDRDEPLEDPTAEGEPGTVVTTEPGVATIDAGPGATTSSTVRASATTSATAGPSTTVAPTRCATDTTSAASISSSLNSVRSGLGLPPLTRSASIDEIAQRWACRMASEGMKHNPDYGTQVFAVCGGCTGVAENVGSNASASGAWTAWMESQTHRNNIQTDRTGKHGIGAARSASGQLFVVHDFAWD